MSTITVLKSVSEAQASQINALMRFLSDKPSALDRARITEIIQANSLIAALDGEVVIGMATLVVINQLSGVRGRVEDVVLLPHYQGQGIGSAMMKHLHSYARIRMGVTKLALTSRPHREAANAMYLKLGYERRETNVYVIDLEKI